jgi:hypothetical protein
MISKKFAKFIKLIKRFRYLQVWLNLIDIWRWLSSLKVRAFSKVEILMFFDERALSISLLIFWVMIDWHHLLIPWHHSPDTLTPLSGYIDITLRIHWHPLARSGKKVARSSAILHARCTRSAQITWFEEKLRSLLSWSSAFETCKDDSKRATFDVIIKPEIRAFLKLFQKFKVLMFLDERALKKICQLIRWFLIKWESEAWSRIWDYNLSSLNIRVWNN